MSRFFERRRPPGLRPCIGAEILRSVLADERSAHLLATPAESRELDRKVALTRREWLGIHFVAFLIMAWNFFAINLARTPGKWWFWIPVAVLATALAVHAAWVILTGGAGLARRTRPGVIREEAGR